MKSLWLVATVVAALVVFGTGFALAAEMEVPEPGTYEFAEALETGQLPAEGEILDLRAPRLMGPEEAGAYVCAGDPLTGHKGPITGAVPCVESGGIIFRIGVSTP